MAGRARAGRRAEDKRRAGCGAPGPVRQGRLEDVEKVLTTPYGGERGCRRAKSLVQRVPGGAGSPQRSATATVPAGISFSAGRTGIVSKRPRKRSNSIQDMSEHSARRRPGFSLVKHSAQACLVRDYLD